MTTECHKITRHDVHEADKMAWHGLTIVKTHEELANYANSKTNVIVNKTPLTFGNVPTVQSDRFNLWTTSGDEEIYLNTVSDNYSVFQNHQLFELKDKILKGIPHKVVSLLTIKALKMFFMTCELYEVTLPNGDKFVENIIFAQSHDGTLSTVFYSSTTRPVCWNTVRVSLKSKGIVDLKANHTEGSQEKMRTWGKELDDLLGYKREWMNLYTNLTEEEVTQETAAQFLTGYLSPNGKPLAKKSENQRETLVSLFNRGKGNRGETKADLLNSITEFYTYGLGYDEKTVAKDPWKIVESSEGGKGAEAKSRAFDLLTNRKAFQETVKAGQNSLALAVAN